MIGFAAQRLMELEVEGLTGATYGEKSQDRLVQRNGYRDRIWETRAGIVELRIPLSIEDRRLAARVDTRSPSGIFGAKTYRSFTCVLASIWTFSFDHSASITFGASPPFRDAKVLARSMRVHDHRDWREGLWVR